MSDNKINIEPLHLNAVTDYHVHCDYSVDAEGTIEEYCEAALKRNLAEICFTTHYDNDPHSDKRMNFIRINGEKKPTSVENLAPYIENVQRAAEMYYLQGLSVKLGVEIGWYQGCEEEVHKLKEAYPLDYILCGIHDIDRICFCCHREYEACFSRYSADEVVKIYFDQVNQAAESKMFNTIAHFGYYLKYGRKYYGDSINTAHEPYLEKTFDILKSSQTALEINTAAIRHGMGHYYPTADIINRAKKAGVDVVYLGSDAHKPEQIGLDFEVAASLVPDNVRGCEG